MISKAAATRRSWFFIGIILVTIGLLAPALWQFTLSGTSGHINPNAYTALALQDPGLPSAGVVSGQDVAAVIYNSTPDNHTYRWSATVGSATVSQGAVYVPSGQQSTFNISTTGSPVGPMRVDLDSGRVFITFPIHAGQLP